MRKEDLNQEGLRIRQEVLGEEYVDAAVGRAGEYDEELQKFVTDFCWRAVWGRPGLTRRERSLINLGMIAVMGREAELRAHTKGALNNGCTKEEIREIMLQVAAYAGFPAALEGFRITKEVIEAHEA